MLCFISINNKQSSRWQLGFPRQIMSFTLVVVTVVHLVGAVGLTNVSDNTLTPIFHLGPPHFHVVIHVERNRLGHITFVVIGRGHVTLELIIIRCGIRVGRDNVGSGGYMFTPKWVTQINKDQDCVDPPPRTIFCCDPPVSRVVWSEWTWCVFRPVSSKNILFNPTGGVRVLGVWALQESTPTGVLLKYLPKFCTCTGTMYMYHYRECQIYLK